MIAEELVQVMESEGVNIPPEEREKVLRDLHEAVKNERIYFIEKNGKTVGFLTYVERPKGTLINYAFIYKAFRDTLNFVALRSFFRDKFKSRFSWKSRRRNKVANVV